MTGELILAAFIVSNIASFLFGRRNKNKVEEIVSLSKKVKEKL